MPGTVLRHSFTVAAQPAAVAAHLSEPRSYLDLSPLVVAVRHIRTHGDVTSYILDERVRYLGFPRYDNPVRVTLRTSGSSAVHGDIVAPGGVWTRYRFELAQEGTGTRVTDTMEMHAPLLIRRLAAAKARSMQLARARILADRLDGS